MIFDDAKKRAAGIMSGIKLNPATGSMSEPMEKMDDGKEDPKEGLRACAQDAMDAIHAKDVEGFMQAMSAFLEMSEDEPKEEDEESPEPQEAPQE